MAPKRSGVSDHRFRVPTVVVHARSSKDMLMSLTEASIPFTDPRDGGALPKEGGQRVAIDTAGAYATALCFECAAHTLDAVLGAHGDQ